MASNSPILQDAFQAQTGGMQSGLDPTLVAETAFVKGINVSIRGGLVHSRGGFSQVFQLPSGTFQGAQVWSLEDADRLVYVVAGTIYVYNMATGAVFTVGALMSQSATRCYLSQIDRYFLIQDGVSRAAALEYKSDTIVYHRSAESHDTSTVDDQLYYVPGTVGQYAQGRYHYVPTKLPLLEPAVDDADLTTVDTLPILDTETGRPYFISSDILDTLNPEYVLRLSEHRILNLGGALALPMELGYITAMTAMRGAATGTGVGELLVFARNGVSAFDVSASRSQWKSIALSKVLFTGAGTLSPFAVRPVNDDVAYLDRFGRLRLLRYDKTRLAGGGGALSNTPMSNEIRYFTDGDDLSQLPYASLTSANNRILWTLESDTNGLFKALASLDLALIHSMAGNATAPAYDGVWTGFYFQQVLEIQDKLYVVVKRNGENWLLAHSDDAAYDLDGTPIQSTLVTRGMNFKDQPNLKTLNYVEVWVKDIATPVSMSVYYRPNSYNKWTLMTQRNISLPLGGPMQYRRRVKFPVDMSETVCNPIDNKPLWESAEFQFAIRWTGSCGIDYFRAVATIHDEMAMDVCEVDNPSGISLPEDEGLDDFDYWA